MLSSDGNIAVVPGASTFHVNAAFAHHLILFCLTLFGLGIPKVKKTLGVVVPCAEMVLIQHNQIPIYGVYPFVFGLDISIAVSAKIVLE